MEIPEFCLLLQTGARYFIPPTKLMLHFRCGIVLFILEGTCTSCYATHATYAWCQRDISWEYSAIVFFGKVLNHKPIKNNTVHNFKKLCYCYGDISYHAPKMDSSNLIIFVGLSSLGEYNFSFLTRHLTSRERLVLPLYDFLFFC